MPFHLHTVELADSSDINNLDRVILYWNANIANLAGTAGTDVTTAVAVTGYQLPATYAVVATPNQDAMASVTSKTSTGFNVVLTPKVATATIAAGTFDVIVIG